MGYFFDQNKDGKLVRFQIAGNTPTATELERINNYLGRSVAPPVTAPPGEEMLSPYMSSLRSSASATLTGAARVAQLAGAPETGGGIADYAKSIDEYTQARSRPTMNFTDIGGIGDFAQWASDVAQTSAGYMTGPLLALAGGAGLAYTAPISVPAALAGGTAFGLTSGAQFFGENLKRQMEERDISLEETNAGAAFGTAVVQTGADILSGKIMGLFGRIGRAVEAKALAPIEQAIADRTWKEFTSQVSARTAKGAIAEAGTETFQQALEVLQANPAKLFALEPDMVNELLNAAAGGLILGGGISAVMGGEGETEISKLDQIAKSLTPELQKFGGDINKAILRNMALQQADPRIIEQKTADAADAEAYAASLRQILRDTQKVKTDPAKELAEKAELDFNNPPPPTSPDDYGVDPEALSTDLPDINPTQAAAGRPQPPKLSLVPLPDLLQWTRENKSPEELAAIDANLTSGNLGIWRETIGNLRRDYESANAGEAVEAGQVDDSTKPMSLMPEPTGEAAPEPKYTPDTGSMMSLAAALAEVQGAKLRREIAASEAALKEAGGDWAAVKAKADAKESGARAAVARLVKAMGVTRADVDFVDAMLEYGTIHNPDGSVKVDSAGRPVTGIISAAEGRYDPVDQANPMQAAIKLSRQVWDPNMTVDEYVNAMTGVAAHELLHHLKNSNSFSDKEWRTLVRQASRERAKARGQDSVANYLDRAAVMYRDPTVKTPEQQKQQRDLVEEEAVAEMFRNWVLNDYKAPPQPKSLMRRVLGMIKSMFTLHHVMNKTMTERVFRQIVTGKKADKGYKAPSPSNLQKGQMAATAGIGLDQHIDPASAFAAQPKYSTVPIGKRIGLGVNLERQRLAYGPRMYNADLPEVVFKELIQNSWDGIKSAYIRGDLLPKHGHIFVRSIPQQQRIIVADNGSGMTPEIVENAYLQIMGSDKSDLPPEMSSGGFGLAKVAFLLAAKRLRLYTVRDEVATYFEASGDDIRDGNVQVFTTPAPGQKSGTWVDVQLPETGEDSDGDSITFDFPPGMEYSKLESRPLIGDVDFIESNSFESEWENGKIVRKLPPIPAPGDFTDAGWYIQELHNVGPRATQRFKKNTEGENSKYNTEFSQEQKDYVKRLNAQSRPGPDGVEFFQKIWTPGQTYQTTSFITTAVTRWGTVDVYMHDLKSSYGASGVVLSSGVYQFNVNLKKTPLSTEPLPYTFVLDVKPKVRALEALYPFEQNREGFSRRVQKDVEAIYGSLQKIAMSRENFNISFKYGDPKYIDENFEIQSSGVKQAIDDIIAQKAGGKDAGVSLGEKVDLDDGTMKRGDGSVVLKAGEVDFGVDPKTLEKLTVSESVYLPLTNQVTIVSNLDRDIVADAGQRMYNDLRYETAEEGSKAAARFLKEYGTALIELKNLFADEFAVWRPLDIRGEYQYRAMERGKGAGRAGKIDKTVVGLAFDKGLHGVNYRIPFPGIGINPFSKLDGKQYEQMRDTFDDTIIRDSGVLQESLIAQRDSNQAMFDDMLQRFATGHATSVVDTMIHELAHESEMHHGESFTIEYHHLRDRLFAAHPNEMLAIEIKLANLLLENSPIYRALLDEYKNAGEKKDTDQQLGGTAYSADPAASGQELGLEGEAGRRGGPRPEESRDLEKRERTPLQITGLDAERAHGRADLIEKQRGAGLTPKFSVVPIDFTPPSLAMIRNANVTETTPKGWMSVIRDYIGRNPGRQQEIDDTGIMNWLAGRDAAQVQFIPRRQVEARLNAALPSFEVRYSKIPMLYFEDIGTQFNTYRSALDEELAKANVGDQSPYQWLNLIKSWVQKGKIKTEEVEDRGLYSWLESRIIKPNQGAIEAGFDVVPDKISKAEIVDMLARVPKGEYDLGIIDYARGVDIGIDAGRARDIAIRNYAKKNYDKARARALFRAMQGEALRERIFIERERRRLRAESANIRWETVEQQVEAELAQTKLDKNKLKQIRRNARADAIREMADSIKANPEKYNIDYNPVTNAYDDYTVPGDNDSYRVILLKGSIEVPTAELHFNQAPEKAVQAWIRFKVRNVAIRMPDDTEATKKVLFVEEIQSDVHQAARKLGYSAITREEAERDKARDARRMEITRIESYLAGKMGIGYYGASSQGLIFDEQAQDISGILYDARESPRLIQAFLSPEQDPMGPDGETIDRGSVFSDPDLRRDVEGVMLRALTRLENAISDFSGTFDPDSDGITSVAFERIQNELGYAQKQAIDDLDSYVPQIIGPDGKLNDLGTRLLPLVEQDMFDTWTETDSRWNALSEAIQNGDGLGNERGEESFYDETYYDYPSASELDDRLESLENKKREMIRLKLVGGGGYPGLIQALKEPLRAKLKAAEKKVATLSRLNEAWLEARDEMRSEPGIIPESVRDEMMPGAEQTLLSYLPQALRALDDTSSGTRKKGSPIPNLPYKRSWPRHMLLAALKHAIQHDAEGVVFAPGVLQNQRYNSAGMTGEAIIVRPGEKRGTYDIFVADDMRQLSEDTVDQITTGKEDIGDFLRARQKQQYDQLEEPKTNKLFPDFKGVTKDDFSIGKYRDEIQYWKAIQAFEDRENITEKPVSAPADEAWLGGSVMLDGKEAWIYMPPNRLMVYQNKRRALGAQRSYDFDYPRLLKEWTGTDTRTVRLEVPGSPERLLTGQEPVITPFFEYAELTPTAKENILGTKNTRWSKYAISPVTVRQVQNQIVYAAASNMAKKALGRLGFGKAVIDRVQDRVDLYTQYLGDKMLPVGQMIDALRAKGLTIPQEFDAYLKLELLRGKTGDRLTAAEEDYFNPLVDAIRTNLKFTQADLNSLRAVSKEFAQYAEGSDSLAKGMLEAYAAAMHAPERNDVGLVRDPSNPFASGFTTAGALAAQKWFQNHSTFAEVQAAHRKLLDIIEFVTNAARVDADLTPDFKKIRPGKEFAQAGHPLGFKWYVPMRGRVDEDPELDPNNPLDMKESETIRTGRGLNVRGPEDWHFLGRGSHVDPVTGQVELHQPPPMIVEHAILQAMQSIIRAEKNKADQSLLKLLQANAQESIEYRGRTRFIKQIARIVRNAPIEKKLINGVVKMVPDAMYKNAENMLTLKVKDTDQNGNPTGLIREISIEILDQRMALALTGSNGFGTGLFADMMAALGGFTQFVAKMSTQWNPLFLLTNFPRDLATAMINLQEYEIKGLSMQVARYIPTAAKAIYKSQDGRTLGYLTGGQAAPRVRHIVGGTDWTDLLERFKRNGGDLNFYGLDDIYQLHIRINEALAPGKGTLATGKRAFQRLGNFIEAYNKTVESSIRLATFKAMIDAGMNDEMAARAAKSVTVNFDKGGIWKSNLNALWLFYNASVQGSLTILSAAARSKNVQKTVGALFVAGIMQDLLNSLMAGDDDETGENPYDLIPQHTLETKMILMDPLGISKNGYLSFPMPFGYNAVFNAGRAMSKMMRGREDPGNTFNTMFGTMVDAFNPMGGSSSLLSAAAPTFLDPVVDLSTNLDYANRHIYKPENPYDVNPPLSQRYWNHTSWTSKQIANFLHNLPLIGGTPMTPGMIEVSPDAIDYLFRFAVGGVGTAILQTENFVTSTIPSMLSGEEWETRSIPAVSKYFGNVGTSRVKDKFFDIMDRSDRADKELKDAIKSGDPTAIKDAMVNNKEMLQFRQTASALSNARLKIQRRIRLIEVNTRIPPDRRQELVAPLKERVKELESKLVGLYNRRIRDAEIQ